jgi:hypothetical protein
LYGGQSGEQMTLSGKEAIWVALKTGGEVLRLWETIGPKEFHVAILRLSDAQYKVFIQDRKRFLVDNDVFTGYSPKLNRIIAEAEISPKPPSNPGDDTWMVMVCHDWNTCNSAMASVMMF